MAVQFEYPEGVAGPPVILVSIENNCRFIAYAVISADFLKSLAIDIVTNDLVLKIYLPVDFYSPWNMTLGI